MNKLPAPLLLRPYRRLLLAYGVNALGTWLGEIALAVLVLRETGSAAAVAAVWVFGQFAPAFLTPALVARLESFPARRVLPALLATEAFLFAVLVASTASFSLPLVLLLVALDGAVGLTARALVKASMVATTEPAGLLREGNSLLVGVFTVCMAVGPFAAGAVVALVSPQAALVVDAASFALAALALGAGARLPDGAGEDGELPFRERLRAGFAHVRERAALRRLLSAFAVVTVFGAAILPLEVVLVTETLHAGEAAYGTVLALWGAGAAFGGALVLPRVRRAPLVALMAAAYGVTAVAYIGMGLAPSLAVVCVFSFIGGTANGVDAFAAMTAIQERTAPEFQARVGGLVEALMAAALGIGFLLGGAIGTAVSVRAAYVFAGVAVLAAIPLLSKRRLRIRVAPKPAVAGA